MFVHIHHRLIYNIILRFLDFHQKNVLSIHYQCYYAMYYDNSHDLKTCFGPLALAGRVLWIWVYLSWQPSAFLLLFQIRRGFFGSGLLIFCGIQHRLCVTTWFLGKKSPLGKATKKGQKWTKSGLWSFCVEFCH